MGQADKLIRVAQSYLGTSQWSDDHLAMVDAYNSVSPIPVGYAVQYSDDWCDIFVTVCGDEAGISHLIGRECGVPRHLAWFQEQGIWLGQEWPQAGDIVIFKHEGDMVFHVTPFGPSCCEILWSDADDAPTFSYDYCFLAEVTPTNQKDDKMVSKI